MIKTEDIVAYLLLTLAAAFFGGIIAAGGQMESIVNSGGFTWSDKQYKIVVISEKKWINTDMETK